MTRWSIVIDCACDGSQLGVGQAAISQLCQDYWSPLYAFIRGRGYSAHDAQDLAQSFLSQLLESRAYLSVDQAKGKFRSFLLAALRNFLADELDWRRSLKRGGGQPLFTLDDNLAEVESLHAREPSAQPPLDEERLYERCWAFAVVSRALQALEADFSDGGKKERVFRELRPFLIGGTDLPDSAAVAARLHITSEALRVHLSRLRTRYRDKLLAEVARTIPADESPEAEMRYLCRILLAAE